MPKVRSPRGTKTRFAPARIQSTISQAYNSAFGGDVSKWRKQIQEHSQRVIVFLGNLHGAGDAAEWSRSDIAMAIEQEIRKNAPSEVHDAYLDLHPERRPRKVSWSKFEAKSTPEPDEDPLWSIQRPSLRETEKIVPDVENVLGSMGTPARKNNRASLARPARSTARPCLRSDWLGFLQRIGEKCKKPLDIRTLEFSIKGSRADHFVKTPEEWWWFWQDFIEGALLSDPRIIEAWREMHCMRERARLCGQDWLDGSGLPGYEATRLLVDDDAAGRALYRRLWQEHMKWWMAQEEAHPGLAEYDLNSLAAALNPDADHLLSWSAWHWMASADGAWPIQVRTWKQVDAIPHQDSREPPQWAFMRLAMALAMPEKENKMSKAIEFYRLFSNLTLSPSDAMLREAGKATPRFCEDSALMVRDKFEAVQQAIHRSATETKWNGTLSIDWSLVRAEGAPVGGRRISQGVPGFLRAIDLSQQALGRTGGDRPVSVMLPIWHRDIETFLSLRHQDTQRLQIVVLVSDAFMDRVRKGEPWWLLDPSDFPQLVNGPNHYEEAVKVVEKNPNRYASTAKSVSSNALWRKLIKSSEQGSPFISFVDISQPDDGRHRNLMGVDGVGSFPFSVDLPGEPWAQWPTIAVNLSNAVTEDGSPDLSVMRKAAEMGLRMLDNAILESEDSLTHNSHHFRPVCLGAVGYFEAISKAMQNRENDKNLLDAWVLALGEGWASVVAAADLAITRERGPAPCFKKEPNYDVFAPHLHGDFLAKKRGGAKNHSIQPSHDWKTTHQSAIDAGQRFSVRTVWAPFDGAATIAGVTPGGLGTLKPFHWILDERRQQRLIPSALLLHMMQSNGENSDDLAKVMRHPDSPGKWPKSLRKLTYPDLAEWNRRLTHASLLAPWIDQGISLTLPSRLPLNELEHIIHRAWHLGLSNIRFETLDSNEKTEEDSFLPEQDKPS